MIDLDILEEVKTNLVEHSCSLRKAFIEACTMVFTGDGTICLLINNQKEFLIYIPYETENKEIIHRNKRNALAKQFIETYGLEQLKAEYEECVNKQNIKMAEYEKQYKIVEALTEQLKPLFCGYGEIKTCNNYGTCIPEIKFDCKVKTADRYKEYHDTLTITVINNIYNVERVTHNRVQSGIKNNYSFTYEQFKNFVNILLDEYKQIEAEEKPKFEALEAERLEQSRISNIANKIYRDREHIYILKSKRSFVAIAGGTRWSSGVGKAGKYYNTDYLKIEKLIKEKGITEVLVLDRSSETYNIDWNNYKFTNISEIA